LTMYLNEIPYGSNAYGIEAAADTFFGKKAKDLTLAETATLVALPKAPTYYSPYGGHTDQLKVRQQYVLDRMISQGYITQAQADEAKQQQLVFVQKIEDIKAPHFVMYVRELLAQEFGDRAVEEGGFQVTTSIDLDEQEKAEKTIKDSVSKINSYGASNAAMVSIDAKTGEILSMVGSVDYFNMERDGNVNVTIAERQPGSSFKPVVYSTAFKRQWSPGSTVWDVSTDFDGYKPTNYNGKTNGPV
jgi:membrane peptidoglycan carboxypeptidase